MTIHALRASYLAHRSTAVTICTTCFNMQNCILPTQRRYVNCHGKEPTFPLINNKGPFFYNQKESVLCEVRTAFLYKSIIKVRSFITRNKGFSVRYELRFYTSFFHISLHVSPDTTYQLTPHPHPHHAALQALYKKGGHTKFSPNAQILSSQTVHFPSPYLFSILNALYCLQPTFTRRTSGHDL